MGRPTTQQDHGMSDRRPKWMDRAACKGLDLRSGESLDTLYLGLLASTGSETDDVDFVSAIMASAVYSLCPDQLYLFEEYQANL